VSSVRLDSTDGHVVHLGISDLMGDTGDYFLRVSDIWDQALERTIWPGRGDVLSFSLPATSLDRVTVSPHPFQPDRDVRLQFAHLPANTSLHIFTLRGELVWAGSTEHGGSIYWPGENRSGHAAASGVYLYLLEGGGETKRDKLVLIR
jgi:hypothetical protein